ncbi:UNKNOWN [Stylonychia lemnae]|uniref:Uncharacterized protein n=1 Tax=Stylonychia lemnae TaxID=5949 RepID=A0A078B9Q9_STYLE|nr:UNKNOWN [Stylonychia lemnae]|eukprot:CDW90298.1 UNKNOWN [Stylonychia lemnae]
MMSCQIKVGKIQNSLIKFYKAKLEQSRFNSQSKLTKILNQAFNSRNKHNPLASTNNLKIRKRRHTHESRNHYRKRQIKQSGKQRIIQFRVRTSKESCETKIEENNINQQLEKNQPIDRPENQEFTKTNKATEFEYQEYSGYKQSDIQNEKLQSNEQFSQDTSISLSDFFEDSVQICIPPFESILQIYSPQELETDQQQIQESVISQMNQQSQEESMRPKQMQVHRKVFFSFVGDKINVLKIINQNQAQIQRIQMTPKTNHYASMQRVINEYRVFDFTIKDNLIESIIDYISGCSIEQSEKQVWLLLQSMISHISVSTQLKMPHILSLKNENSKLLREQVISSLTQSNSIIDKVKEMKIFSSKESQGKNVKSEIMRDLTLSNAFDFQNSKFNFGYDSYLIRDLMNQSRSSDALLLTLIFANEQQKNEIILKMLEQQINKKSPLFTLTLINLGQSIINSKRFQMHEQAHDDIHFIIENREVLDSSVTKSQYFQFMLRDMKQTEYDLMRKTQLQQTKLDKQQNKLIDQKQAVQQKPLIKESAINKSDNRIQEDQLVRQQAQLNANNQGLFIGFKGLFQRVISHASQNITKNFTAQNDSSEDENQDQIDQLIKNGESKLDTHQIIENSSKKQNKNNHNQEQMTQVQYEQESKNEKQSILDQDNQVELAKNTITNEKQQVKSESSDYISHQQNPDKIENQNSNQNIQKSNQILTSTENLEDNQEMVKNNST